MSGHSKWATTKHKKAAIDAKRGKIFTKLIREMTVAARIGGGDTEANPRLRTVVSKAKEVNMPADNMKRAILKGTGELAGVVYEETTYEGYGPGGVALLLEIMTDNKNRTVSEVRHTLGKNGGNMAENGAVSWLFDRRGLIVIPKEGVDESDLMDLSLEAGAEDLLSEDPTHFEVVTPVSNFETVNQAILDANLKSSFSEVTFIPQTKVKLEGKQAEQMLRLMDELEDNDDVQNVYANFDISDEEMEKISG